MAHPYISHGKVEARREAMLRQREDLVKQLDALNDHLAASKARALKVCPRGALTRKTRPPAQLQQAPQRRTRAAT